MVHRIGLEPTTLCSEDRCSNPLSYRCILLFYHKVRFCAIIDTYIL